jgi:hypothetical protein
MEPTTSPKTSRIEVRLSDEERVRHERNKERNTITEQKRTGEPLKRRCIGDGGRPSVVALQEEATNHPEVRRSRAVVLSVGGKGVPPSTSGMTR